MKKFFCLLLCSLLFCGFLLAEASGQQDSSKETGTVQTESASANASVSPTPAGGDALKTTLPPLVIPPDLYEDEAEEENKGFFASVKDGILDFWDYLKSSAYTNFVKDNRWQYLTSGFLVTMEISICAVLIGILIGFTVAVIRSISDQTGKMQILNRLCKIYLTVIRGTPVVVQLLIIYFVILGPFDVNKVLVAIIAFGVNSGAYVTEVVRSGINAIDPGQLEAGRSLGLTYLQTMRLIILPQAFKNVLPALGNEFISLLKETSISGYIALQDITKGGDIIRSQTYDAFLPLTAVALTYLAVVMLFTWLLGRLERKLKKNER